MCGNDILAHESRASHVVFPKDQGQAMFMTRDLLTLDIPADSNWNLCHSATMTRRTRRVVATNCTST